MKIKLINGKQKIYSWLQPIQDKYISYLLPKIPPQIETYHLTLLTLPLSILAVYLGLLSRQHPWLLVLNSLIIFVQYTTDCLDGAVGRYRKTGLVRWGFYMDHLFDFVFACSMVVSYALSFKISLLMLFLALITTSTFFVHELLKCIASGQVLNKSGYYGFSPTEIRTLITILNPFIIFLPLSAKRLLFYITTFLAIFAIIYLIVKQQFVFWSMDLAKKKRNDCQ